MRVCMHVNMCACVWGVGGCVRACVRERVYMSVCGCGCCERENERKRPVEKNPGTVCSNFLLSLKTSHLPCLKCFPPVTIISHCYLNVKHYARDDHAMVCNCFDRDD